LEKLIALEEYPVQPVLRLLLQDKTTKQNIIWATNTYASLGYGYTDHDQMQPSLLSGFRAGIIQPRTQRSREDQAARTRQKAEVYTPIWICNLMNNTCDEEWFGRKDVFNIQTGTERTTVEKPIDFPEKKKWTDYIDSRRLEITCGEAPFLVSRYDASTGEVIPIKDRIGILDRKLRIVNENTQTEEKWLKWTMRAFQSVYGYEYQGDSLLIARANLINTFTEYLNYRWHRKATNQELSKIANIIAWNLWQMDGLTYTVPGGAIVEESYQMTLFDIMQPEGPPKPSVRCKIFDWRAGQSMLYSDIKRGY
jgi:hypothetical protein